jgi:hypothetical protein
MKKNEYNIYIDIYSYKINNIPPNNEYNVPIEMCSDNDDMDTNMDTNTDKNSILTTSVETNQQYYALTSREILKSILNGGNLLLNNRKMCEFYKAHNARALNFNSDIFIKDNKEGFISLLNSTIEIMKKAIDHRIKNFYEYSLESNKYHEYTNIYADNYFSDYKKAKKNVGETCNLSDETILNLQGLIYNINMNSDDKYIIFGDFHGSYHSFFRLMLRLQKQKIINLENFTIADNYKLIFLGDIVDRGNYGFEILSTLLQFFVINNNGKEIDKWKIYINRGNHEHISQYAIEGFLNELLQKKIIDRSIPIYNTQTLLNYYNNNQKIYYREKTKLTMHFFAEILEEFNKYDTLKLINTMFAYCSSSIILNFRDKKYWLCHGGFPCYLDNNVFPDENHYKENNLKEQSVIRVSVYMAQMIRWADFNMNHENKHFNMYTHIRVSYNDTIVNKFMKTFNFIIRGHQDNMISASLLLKNVIKSYSNPSNNEYECLYGEKIDNYVNKNINVNNNKSFYYLPLYKLTGKYIDLGKYNNDGNIAESYIYRIHAHESAANFSNSTIVETREIIYNIDNKTTKKYNTVKCSMNFNPVLTISTNNDNKRNVTSDCYVMLHVSTN